MDPTKKTKLIEALRAVRNAAEEANDEGVPEAERIAKRATLDLAALGKVAPSETAPTGAK